MSTFDYAGSMLRVAEVDGKHFFHAVDLARIVGYKRPGAVGGGPRAQWLATHTVPLADGPYLTEAAAEQLVCHEKYQNDEVVKWFKDVVLHTLRQTRRDCRWDQMQLLNENDLHRKTVDFLRKYYPEVVLVPGLGEFQDTNERRLEGYWKGYKSGQPDLLVCARSGGFVGLALELKTPLGVGTTSDTQTEFLSRLEAAGWKTLVSSSYDEILVTLMDYLRNRGSEAPSGPTGPADGP